MLCWICNVVNIEDVLIDPKDNKIRHCHVCEGVIQENLTSLSGEPQDDGELVLLDTFYDDNVVEPEVEVPNNTHQARFFSGES